MTSQANKRPLAALLVVVLFSLLVIACGGPTLENAYRDADGYFEMKYPEGYRVETLDVGPHKAPAIFMPTEIKRLDQADRFFTADVSSLYDSRDDALSSFRDNLQASGRSPGKQDVYQGKHAEWHLLHFSETDATGFMAFCQGPEAIHIVTFRWKLSGEEAEVIKAEFFAVLDHYQPVK